ncbi:Transcriptional regulator SlyA [invertebrate metagenome]|uniref:Transcriptional regulator SlyA n=1 Tax=invertebrate metagenome TaxID=1711999 RepID=A0A2H9T8E3_9ZZZZ
MKTLTLAQSFDRIDRHLNKMWRNYKTSEQFLKISFNDYDYLQSIHALNSPRLSDIAQDIHVSTPSASNMIAKLEKKGLVARHQDPDDRRAIRIQLTQSGQRLMELDLQLFSEFTEQIRNTLSDDDCHHLERLLSNVCQQFSPK